MGRGGKPDQDGIKSVGVDVARSGLDKSVAAIRHGDVITAIQAWAKADTMETSGTRQGIIEARPRSRVVDVIGIGAGVFDRLRERASGPTRSRRAQNHPHRFDGQFGSLYIRSFAWWAARDVLEPPLRLDSAPAG